MENYSPYLETIRKIATLRGVDLDYNDFIDLDSAFKINRILNELDEILAWQRMFLK